MLVKMDIVNYFLRGLNFIKDTVTCPEPQKWSKQFNMCLEKEFLCNCFYAIAYRYRFL